MDGRRASRRRIRVGQIVWQRVGHERARSMSGRQVALGDQLFVGQERRRSRDPEVVGQRARRQQFVTARQRALENRLPNRAIDLRLQAIRQARIDVNERCR